MNIDKKLFKKMVADNLKLIRKSCGYKCASEFAAEKKISIQTYLNHESGKRGMSIFIIIYYACLLDVEYTSIIGNSQVLQKCFKNEVY